MKNENFNGKLLKDTIKHSMNSIFKNDEITSFLWQKAGDNLATIICCKPLV